MMGFIPAYYYIDLNIRCNPPAKPRDSGNVMRDDPDAVALSMDWSSTRPVELDLDPALLEAIRARGRLKSLTLRVGIEQIEEARRIAKETGLKYQAVLRRWLAEGASRSRRSRGQSAHPDHRAAR
jgi:hypothetical protein